MFHPSAFVHPQANVHESAIIGPWCIVDAGAEIGEKVVLESRVRVYGGVTIGKILTFMTELFSGRPRKILSMPVSQPVWK